MATGRIAGLGWTGRASGPGAQIPEFDREMTVIEHLEALRRALIFSLVAWALATAVAFAFNHQLIWILERPLHLALVRTHSPFGQRVVVTSPIEGLSIPFEVAAAAGLVLALPVLVWQAWGFNRPGLRRHEQRLAFPFIFSALFFFALGAVFAYFVVPVGLSFLATFLGGNAVYLPDLGAYLGFLSLIVIVFGLTFELPVALCILGALGVVSSQRLRSWRKPAYFAIVLAALVITPGADPFTPSFLAVALILLYEGSILVVSRALRR